MLIPKYKNKVYIIGVMSGTSLDGIDLALCEFNFIKGLFSYNLIKAKTINYSPTWKKILSSAHNLSAVSYFKTHAAYGNFIAQQINKFLKKSKFSPVAIASHGHTVFHQPNFGFSSQLGCGATIAAKTNKITICDFRSLDVANSGQGAPLVPIGDKYLFGEFEACLNIGGIANISFDNKKNDRIAYDVCVANMLLNYLAEKTGAPFDRGGELAKAGKIDEALLNELNGLDYYSKKVAKSIGREWFEKNILIFFKNNKQSLNDLLATASEHIACVIANDLNNHNFKTVLVTGGGAFNSNLIARIKSKTNCKIIIPSSKIINFKEAIIFGFLGYLRLNHKINTLKSVTGSFKDSSGGSVYLM